MMKCELGSGVAVKSRVRNRKAVCQESANRCFLPWGQSRQDGHNRHGDSSELPLGRVGAAEIKGCWLSRELCIQTGSCQA